jgi:hypothetical protein
LKKFEKCETYEKFRAFVAKAFRKSPLKPDFDENMLVWDWKAWLHPHLRDLKGFKDFWAFRFTLNEDSDLVMMYKNSILDSAWLGFEGSLHDGIYFKFLKIMFQEFRFSKVIPIPPSRTLFLYDQ